jgi:hypothetical protein
LDLRNIGLQAIESYDGIGAQDMAGNCFLNIVVDIEKES